MQIEDNFDDVCKNYFLKSPIGNHHVVFNGNHLGLFEAFMNYLVPKILSPASPRPGRM